MQPQRTLGFAERPRQYGVAMLRSLRLYLLFVLLLSPLLGCGNSRPAEQNSSAETKKDEPGEEAASQAQASPPAEAPRYSGPITFTDATAQAGIQFKHNNGAFGKKYLPETLGSGCAFIDFDNDGWQDILLINSTNWPGHPGPKSYSALYHNNKNGTFTDVTREAGLAVEMYGLGVSAADFDNDGNIDIYITALGPNKLFRNLGGGKFADVTARAGVGDSGFSTSSMWFDYDRDGKLDLFV